EAAVDGHQVLAGLDQHHVEADLAEASQGNQPDNGLHGTPFQTAGGSYHPPPNSPQFRRTRGERLRAVNYVEGLSVSAGGCCRGPASDTVETVEVSHGRLEREHLEREAAVEALQTRLPPRVRSMFRAQIATCSSFIVWRPSLRRAACARRSARSSPRDGRCTRS